MKRIILYITLLIPVMTFSQNKGNVVSNISTQLDILCKDKSILISRIALTGITDTKTIPSENSKSFLVYNTNNKLHFLHGYYYWYNDKWNSVKNIITASGVPRSIGVAGDVYIDSSTNDVYFQNGSIWISKITGDETLTDAAFEGKSGILKMMNADGLYNYLNLFELIPGFKEPKSISLNAMSGTISYIDKNDSLTVLNMRMLLSKTKNITSGF